MEEKKMTEFKELITRCGIKAVWLEKIAGLSQNTLFNWMNPKRSKPYSTNEDAKKLLGFLRELDAYVYKLRCKYGYITQQEKIIHEELNNK